MDISTSTNICAFGRGRERYPVEFSINTCADAGYRVLDINFCMAMNPQSAMRTDGWQTYVQSLGELAAKRGIVFRQAHLPYYDVDRDRGTAQAEVMEELIRRSLQGCAMLGVRWAVTHPFTVRAAGDDMAVSERENLRYYAPHVELAKRLGVGIALENDFEYRGGMPAARTYCAAMGELTALCDAFAAPDTVGICYDFGHANLTGGHHRQNLNRIGNRLKAIHVQDNHGLTDEHLMPFYGSIDWVDAMAGLADIAFPGDLTFEIQEFGRYLPPDMKHLVVEQSLVIGRRLVDMIEAATMK